MKILKCPKCEGRAYRQYDRIGDKWVANDYVRCPKCGAIKLSPTVKRSEQVGGRPAEERKVRGGNGDGSA